MTRPAPSLAKSALLVIATAVPDTSLSGDVNGVVFVLIRTRWLETSSLVNLVKRPANDISLILLRSACSDVNCVIAPILFRSLSVNEVNDTWRVVTLVSCLRTSLCTSCGVPLSAPDSCNVVKVPALLAKSEISNAVDLLSTLTCVKCVRLASGLVEVIGLPDAKSTLKLAKCANGSIDATLLFVIVNLVNFANDDKGAKSATSLLSIFSSCKLVAFSRPVRFLTLTPPSTVSCVNWASSSTVTSWVLGRLLSSVLLIAALRPASGILTVTGGVGGVCPPVASISTLTRAPAFTGTPALTVLPVGSIACATSLDNGLPLLIAGLPGLRL